MRVHVHGSGPAGETLVDEHGTDVRSSDELWQLTQDTMCKAIEAGSSDDDWTGWVWEVMASPPPAHRDQLLFRVEFGAEAIG